MHALALAWDAVREDVCRPFTIINFLRVCKNRDDIYSTYTLMTSLISWLLSENYYSLAALQATLSALWVYMTYAMIRYARNHYVSPIRHY
jgi:hypothetical protein